MASSTALLMPDTGVQLPVSNDTLIFDLDGTISDPSVGILRSINYALSSFGYPAIEAAVISDYIGPPIDLTFQNITGTTSAAHTLDLVAKFRERYADVGYSANVLYPGVAEVIQTLAESGVRLGVCTSKRVDFAERILMMFELHPCFSFFSGGDVGIPKTTQLIQLLQDAVVGPGSTMIGDRAVDILAGKKNALSTVGVLWGHGSESELVDAGAVKVLSDPHELRMLAPFILKSR
jgi:phosphoglycolate phosphatase